MPIYCRMDKGITVYSAASWKAFNISKGGDGGKP